MVSKHGAAPPPLPQVLHVTAPTPSEHSHCSEEPEHRSLSSAYSTGEQGASLQYLSVLSKLQIFYIFVQRFLVPRLLRIASNICDCLKSCVSSSFYDNSDGSDESSQVVLVSVFLFHKFYCKLNAIVQGLQPDLSIMC